jgi:DNA-binding transcriptional LysR family regulator
VGFERDLEVVRITPSGPLVGTSIELELAAAVSGLGMIHTFEEEVAAALSSGALEPVLTEWWQDFSGPFLYYPGRSLVPAPLRGVGGFP